MSYGRAKDVTADLTAVGAGNALDLVTGNKYGMLPRAIYIGDATETIERIDGILLEGTAIESFFLKTNVVHDIAFRSLEFDAKTAKAIKILGING